MDFFPPNTCLLQFLYRLNIRGSAGLWNYQLMATFILTWPGSSFKTFLTNPARHLSAPFFRWIAVLALDFVLLFQLVIFGSDNSEFAGFYSYWLKSTVTLKHFGSVYCCSHKKIKVTRDTSAYILGMFLTPYGLYLCLYISNKTVL